MPEIGQITFMIAVQVELSSQQPCSLNVRSNFESESPPSRRLGRPFRFFLHVGRAHRSSHEVVTVPQFINLAFLISHPEDENDEIEAESSTAQTPVPPVTYTCIGLKVDGGIGITRSIGLRRNWNGGSNSNLMSLESGKRST